MTAVDWALICLLGLFLAAVCTAHSRARLLWVDELYGARVLGASSFSGMLRGWYQGADGGGLIYYLLARLWVNCLGFSELTLRLFSTAGMCLALALTWITARRYFPTVVVAFAVGVVYLTSPLMLWQELNGRFYGLFLASAALANLLFVITAERTPSTRGDLIWTALAHISLVGSHILGVVYSFGLLVGMVLLDHRQNRRRLPLYGAVLVSWLLVIPLSFHAIRSSASIATTAFWTEKPPLFALLPPFAIYGRLTGALLVLVLLLAMLRSLMSHVWPSVTRAGPLLPVSVLALVGSVLLAQLILFTKSQFGVSVYADRYLLPVSTVTVFLFAACIARIAPSAIAAPVHTGSKLLFSVLVLIPCCLFDLSRHVYADAYPAPGYPQRLTAPIPAGSVVLADAGEFNLLTHYDHAHTALFMLDWPFDEQHPGFGDWDGHLMENWRRAGYETDRILPCPAIFSRYSDLYLLLDSRRERWFNDRLRSDPDYQVRELAHNTEWQPVTLWSVHQLRSGPPPC